MLRMLLRSIIILTGLWLFQPAISQMDVQQVSSPKGIQAWLSPEPNLDVVSMTFSFRGGAAYVPSGKSGLTILLASMLTEGTKRLNNHELKDYFLDNGIQLLFEVSHDRFSVHLRTTIDNLDNAVDIIREIFYSPRFDPDDFQRVLTAQKIALEHDLKQPATQASSAHSKMIVANHPYSFSVFGTLASLSNITIADLAAFLKQILTRDSLIVGICGKIDAERAGQVLDKLLGDLPIKSTLAQLPTPVANFQAETQFISSVNPQAIVLFSQNGLAPSDPDFIKLMLLEKIMGNGMSSRLWKIIREEKGLAYSIGVGLTNCDKFNMLHGSLGTDPHKAKQAIEIIDKIWQDIKNNGVTEVELAEAKSYALGYFPLMFTSTYQTADVLHGFQVSGFDRQYLIDRTRIINDVSLAQINSFAKDFINPSHLMITIVSQPHNSNIDNTNADSGVENQQSVSPAGGESDSLPVITSDSQQQSSNHDSDVKPDTEDKSKSMQSPSLIEPVKVQDPSSPQTPIQPTEK